MRMLILLPMPNTPLPQPAGYLVTAVRRGRSVQFERPDVAPAFATVRRLRALGWQVSLAAPGEWR